MQVSAPWSNWPGSVPISAAVVTVRSAVPVLVTVKVSGMLLAPTCLEP